MKFVETFLNVFRVPDLRRRVLFTLAMLAVYRIGGHIPTRASIQKRCRNFSSRPKARLWA